MPDVGSQHPPPLHMLPAQQALPAVPHAWQTPWPQISPAAEHCVWSA
jgi:hypothetical protein